MGQDTSWQPEKIERRKHSSLVGTAAVLSVRKKKNVLYR
jgi:hypothetical protein